MKKINVRPIFVSILSLYEIIKIENWASACGTMWIQYYVRTKPVEAFGCWIISVWLCYFQFYCCCFVYSHFKNRSVFWILISTKIQMGFSNFDRRNVARSAAEIRYFFFLLLTYKFRFEYHLRENDITPAEIQKANFRFEISLQLTHLEFVFFYCHWLPKVDLHAKSWYFIQFFLLNLKLLNLRDLNLISNFFFISSFSKKVDPLWLMKK